MRLVRFTTRRVDRPVFINPELVTHVYSQYPMKEKEGKPIQPDGSELPMWTEIHIQGALYAVSVTESLEEVVNAIDYEGAPRKGF